MKSGSVLARASESVVALITAAAVVVTGLAPAPTGMSAGETGVLRFLFVVSVVLISLVIYRWTWERRVRQEAKAFVAASEKKLALAKDQFIANVSHGLRTPLTGIVGFSHMLKEDIEKPDNLEAVDLIISESAELSRVVDDLLIAARIDAGVLEIKTQDVAFIEQISPVLDFMKLLGANVAVDCQDAQIVVDPERFRHALRNLLVNAHRHGQPTVSITGKVQHGRYICDITDEGSGVPPTVEDRLFMRFAYRSTGEVNGNVGLGLSVVKELCDQMETQVSYRRSRGKTHFILSAPLAEVAEAPLETRLPTRFAKIPERLIRVKDRQVKIPA